MLRLNQHMTHFEDLVLLGTEGLNELNNKINNINSLNIHYTTKIDGAPAVIIWSHFEGFPDNSISLKSFIRGSTNKVLSSIDDVENAYGDRPLMCEKLKYCLQIAKYIPSGEAWQGDCLYTANSLKTQNILGQEYVTFQPNKIIYAVNENNTSYEKIIHSDFGICFHTIYTGNAQSMSQSFNVDASKLKNVPSNIFIMSPTVKRPEKFSPELKKSINIFYALSEKLLNNKEDFDELTENALFIKYWHLFENNYLSDNKTNIINSSYKNNLIDFIKNKLKAELEKKLNTLKTEKNKNKANETYLSKVNELVDIVDNSKILDYMVDCINAAAKIKLTLLDEFPNIDFSTFFKSKTKGYFKTAGEGIVMSDNDGNVVKLVDRSTFSNANRDDDIERGFTEDLNDNNFETKYAVVAFGRFNPPTLGHEKLVKTIIMYANKYNGDALLYLSHKQNNNNDPLSYNQKLKYCKEAFHDVNVINSNAKTIIEVMQELYEKKYTDIIYICGEDRFVAMNDLLLKYNNNTDKAGNFLYSFNSIIVKSAGQRDADSDDFVETISASMARQLVKEDNFDDFKDIVPLNENSAKLMFNNIAAVYNVKLTEAVINDKKDLKQLINIILNKLASISVMNASSRHPKELARIKINNQYKETDVIKTIETLLNNIPDVVYIDYNFHSEASHSFKSFKFEFKNEDYYITISNKQKKEFIPNKILRNILGKNIPYNNVINNISYDDENIQAIMKSLCVDAMNTQYQDSLQDVLENISSVPAKINFYCNDTVNMLKQLEPELLNRIINGLEVDFNEIYGAISLASCISNIYKASANIIFPSRSNEPLLDYTIYIPNKPLIRVSAKTGHGASPSCTSMFNSIDELLKSGYNNKKFLPGIEFSKFMINDYLPKSVNNGYVFLKDTMIDIINGKSNT